MTDDSIIPVVEYWARNSTTPRVSEYQNEVHRKLQELERRGNIASFDSNLWGKCVPYPVESSNDATDISGGAIWDIYSQFTEWAIKTGHELKPGFRRYERTSIVSTESDEVIRLPLLSLAIYVESELQAVFPCSTNERVWTVQNGLDLLDPTQSLDWSDFTGGTMSVEVPC